uniref:Eukaryotic translation initiation factor 3 subunit I n=2 Tax=Amblyomma TaxID=6942 RepID=A0A023GIG9_AMBTT
MRPLMLHGHERAITQIKYNREGDLLFSCAKDHSPNVYYSLNGERLGNFIGHAGAVWCIDVNWDSTRVISGAGDNTCRVWDLERGVNINTINTPTAVRTCMYSFSGRMFMYSTDKAMGRFCEIHIVDTADRRQMEGQDSAMVIPVNQSKVTSALWWHYDDGILSAHEDGTLATWDVKSGIQLNQIKGHNLTINDLQYSKDQSFFITASKDTTSKLFDADTLEHLKTYKTERPVNSAAISPIREHVVLGGGQEAMDVTTSSVKAGKFDARFFHLIFEEEFGKVKDHFGPINSVAFHPDGKSYSSGGEDGYVRVHYFDPSYFDFQVEV